MKKWIHSSTEIVDGPVFILNMGNKDFIFHAEGSNITDKVIRKFINAVCDYKNVSDSIRQAALYDKATLNDFSRRITKGDLEYVHGANLDYYKISGRNFSWTFPEEDFSKDVIVIN